MATLRSWLRRNPQPHSLRVVLEDGEERNIRLSDDSRNRWKAAEEAVQVLAAVSVQCIAADGAVLRVQQLREDEDPEGTAEPEHKAVAKSTRELAGVLDRFGHQLNEAFERGANAANMGQENLVELIHLMTQQHAMAISNLHNVSVNLANMMIKFGGGEPPAVDENQAGIERLMVAAATRAMMGGPEDKPKPSANGKK
jgi:hypothetical protein